MPSIILADIRIGELLGRRRGFVSWDDGVAL